MVRIDRERADADFSGAEIDKPAVERAGNLTLRRRCIVIHEEADWPDKHMIAPVRSTSLQTPLPNVVVVTL